LAINSGDFYVIFQRENHFINKRIQKPRRLNMKYIPAVNSVNKTNRNRYNSVLKISCKIFNCQLKPQRDMEGVLFKKVVTTALFCRPNKRSPDEPRETEVNADISSFQCRPFNFFSGTIFVGIVGRRR
jgi:hypothetical protein